MVHRINYNHGVFLMKLWIEEGSSENKYIARLNPGSEEHHFNLVLEGEAMQMEHFDLTVPESQFDPIDKSDIPDSFSKDVAWAEKTMDSAEKKANKKKK